MEESFDCSDYYRTDFHDDVGSKMVLSEGFEVVQQEKPSKTEVQGFGSWVR